MDNDDIDRGASNERRRHAYEEYARRLHNGQCVHCGATFLGGVEPHQLTVTDELGTRIELRCGNCIEIYSSACWNDEEWGPYPAKIQHRPRSERSDS